MNEIKPAYCTDRLPLAAFLVAKGFELIKHERNDAFVVFWFPDSPELQKSIQLFLKNGKVPIKSFLDAQDTVWGIVKNERT